MEYIYAALLLHKANKKITEESITTVVASAGIEVNESQVKALIAALEDVNIEEAISTAAVASAPIASAPKIVDVVTKEEEKKEEISKEEEEESGMAGLGALFG